MSRVMHPTSHHGTGRSLTCIRWTHTARSGHDVMMSSVAQFSSSADAFVAVVAQVPHDAWERPALGEWTVRSLVGHTTRALLTVEQYLHLEPPAEVTIPTAALYYATVYEQFTDSNAVTQRGIAAGIWLGDEQLLRITDALARAKAAIEAAPPDRAVSIGGMGIPLEEYLRTRVFELVVHTIDLARAIEVPCAPPPDAVESCAVLAVSAGNARGDGEAVLLALTGRGSLPDGFSVV
ncbi:mycothiol maleylpyruvate isomerase [Curtobacterium sp. MCBD17_034]|nr:mycothiol maleylpyruvate isomerase [Curtobacterium sp. MCBD17_034]